MKDTIVNTKMLTVMFGILLIGSVAAMVGIHQSTKAIEDAMDLASEEYGVDIFV